MSNVLLFDGKSYSLGNTKSRHAHDVTGNAAHEWNAAFFHGIIACSLPPHSLAKPGCDEHAEQVALFAWQALVTHKFGMGCLDWMFAVPNGGSRGDTDRSRKIAGGMLKAEGVRKGVSDVCVPFPVKHDDAMYAGLWLEMKTAKGGDGGSKEQHDFIKVMTERGYQAFICNGWHEARFRIVQYFRIQPIPIP